MMGTPHKTIVDSFPPMPRDPGGDRWTEGERAIISAYALACALNALAARDAERAAVTVAARDVALSEEEIDLIANDGMRNAAGGIYATCVYEFARAIEAHVAQRAVKDSLTVADPTNACPECGQYGPGSEAVQIGQQWHLRGCPTIQPVRPKDHVIREAVNELRDIAINSYGTQQLRELISQVVHRLVGTAFDVPGDTQRLDWLGRYIAEHASGHELYAIGEYDVEVDGRTGWLLAAHPGEGFEAPTFREVIDAAMAGARPTAEPPRADLVVDDLDLAVTKSAALALVARAVGVVITISQVALEPLAMGHYRTVVEVRPARMLAKGETA